MLEKKQGEEEVEARKKNRCFERKTQKVNIGMWSVLFALLAIMLDYLFFSFSFMLPSRPCALRLQFIAYTWIRQPANNNYKKESRKPFAFLYLKKKEEETMKYMNFYAYVLRF